MSETERRDDAESGGERAGRLSRRTLLKAGLGAAIGVGAIAGLAKLGDGARPGDSSIPASRTQALWRHPASYFENKANKYVRCTLCPKHCFVGPGGRGECEVRENTDGEYYTLVYGRAASVNIDPIEKKPLFHVLPGSPIFSFATAGCNLECKNCQNWQLSQTRPERLPATHLPPARLVDAAQEQGCSLIAGTYSEPIVFFEYLLAVAKEGNRRGLRTTMISAGYIERQPMIDLCQELAAVKIDLKSMRDSFYQTNCEGTLQPVLDTIELVKSQGVWLEIVYLVIPTLNDSEEEIGDLAKWVKGNLGVDVPLHFSRFHPAYRLTRLPPTPYETLDRCYEIARAEGLHYVYVGNVPGSPAQNTLCPSCGKELIRRQNFRIVENHVKQGRCEFCKQVIPGVWS
jgi:pyruvate formate lyase activating enzyme